MDREEAMSAITGIVHFNKQPINIEHGINIMKALEKFPADDIQVWCKDNVFLGCHAQWITPESIGEPLPYYDYETQCVITADAIIDNREELFERLQVKNEDRKNITDSKLILLSYYKWGVNAPKFFVGDFAFMIWDSAKNRLFGARDFTGARTLYYFRDKQRVAFSTIIQPLFILPYIEKQLNEHWLAEFIAIPDMLDSVNPASTVYKNIEQIPPSHIILIEDLKITLQKFPAINFDKKLLLNSNEEYEEAFRDVFQTAVSEKTRTHKNVGAQISGGLDSSSVVSFAVNSLKKKNKRVQTYSYIPPSDFIDFTPKDRMANERPFIESIVQHVGNIDDNYLDFKGRSPLTEVDELLEVLEMPYKYSENSFWLKGIYERASEDGAGILLSGAGGNFTISWGLRMDYYAFLLKKFKLFHLYKEVNQYCSNTGVGRSRMLSAIGKKAYPSIYQLISTENNSNLIFPNIISDEFAIRTKVISRLKKSNFDIEKTASRDVYQFRREWFDNGLYWNTSGTLATKLSLRHAIWNRDPTNDLRVIRFCLAVPEEQFVQNGFNRSLIRRSTKDYLPDEVRLNYGIRGIQGADWVYRLLPLWESFISELRQLTNDPLISEFLNVKLLRSLILKYEKEPRSDYAFNPEFRMLMRSIIISRFIKKFS
jgi:asparagine synthase (glutamine-hydrolysing)